MWTFEGEKIRLNYYTNYSTKIIVSKIEFFKIANSNWELVDRSSNELMIGRIFGMVMNEVKHPLYK